MSEWIRAAPGELRTDGVVVTKAHFTKVDFKKIAPLAHQGLTHSTVPVHTMFDGDLYSRCRRDRIRLICSV